MEVDKFWLEQNEKEHKAIQDNIESLKSQMSLMSKAMDVVPLLIKVIIILVFILGLPLGIERVFPLFTGK